MTDAALTLKSIFCADPDAPIADLLATDEAREALAEACKAAPAPLRAGLEKALTGSLDALFDVGLGSVLQASWSKLDVLRKAFEATLADPAKIVHVPLLDHKVASTHTPSIDLLLGEKAVTKLEFAIVLALDLRGVQLDVRGGKIHGLAAGECEGQGTFSLAGQTLLRRSTPPLKLPGRLVFVREEA